MEFFPPLIHLAVNKEATVADYICWNMGAMHWDVTFVQAVHDWELVLLADFMTHLFHQDRTGN